MGYVYKSVKISARPHFRRCHQPDSIPRDTREQFKTCGQMLYRRFRYPENLVPLLLFYKCGYNRCGEVVARLLSPKWRGYQSCGEVTQPSVARLLNLWRDYLWRGVTGPIFRWNQQHFNYILVSVARFLPYFI